MPRTRPATTRPPSSSKQVHRDEIEHVRFGWRWLQVFKGEDRSAWHAYHDHLTWPLRPAKARGKTFHRRGREAAGLDDDFIRRLELVFEPWMERTLDVGCAAALAPDGLLAVSLHRLLVDGAGRFRGLELVAGAGGLDGPWLAAPERAYLSEVLDGVGAALEAAGFAGLFGIDAWRYVQPDGTVTFHPLGEINGRLTFGWVARALVERLREPLGLEQGRRVRLIFGKASSHDRGRAVPPLEALAPGDPECRLEIPATD